MKTCILTTFSVLLICLSSFAQQQRSVTAETETTIRKYLDASDREPIEGIYKSMGGAYYRIGIKKTAENKYVAVVLDMDPKLKRRWKVGDVKAQFEKSTVPYLYSVRWIWNDKSPQETVATFENNSIIRMENAVEGVRYLKIYPTTQTN